MVRYSIEQRIFLVDTYIRKKGSVKCLKKCILKFCHKYPESPVPTNSYVHALFRKWRTKGSVLDQKKVRKKSVLTEEKLANIQAILEMNPQKSLRRLSQEVGVSYTSTQRATKVLNFRPYHIRMMATRWGIASAGKISHDFVTALSTLPSNEHEVVAVAAQQLDRAKNFAAEHGIPKAYGSYKELAKDPNVDVVYIGTINTLHLDVGKLMLNNGKHVLCEKPLTLNLKQTKELISLAKEKKLFLMEAVWSRCFPAYEALREELESGSLGEVLQVVVNFGVVIEDIDRVRLKELGGGTILDLGIYVLQFSQLVFGPKPPECVVARGHLNENGVDTSASIILHYKGGKTASLSTHSRVKLANEAFVTGTKGTLKVHEPYWCPTSITTPEKTKEFILPTAPKPFNFTNSAGLRYEAMEVRRCLKEGLLESPRVTHEDSLILAQLEDEIRKQLGVKYDQD